MDKPDVAARHASAIEPEDLARLLVERVNAADLDGVVALYEPEAVLALPGEGSAAGHNATRRFYAELLAGKPRFEPGQQLPALRLGDLALTSTRLVGGGATAEIARRQADGSWRWAVDRPNVRE
ncbi:MAG: YybH family protein [Solirubrobacteraceae bacterium]